MPSEVSFVRTFFLPPPSKAHAQKDQSRFFVLNTNTPLTSSPADKHPTDRAVAHPNNMPPVDLIFYFPLEIVTMSKTKPNGAAAQVRINERRRHL
jgi:hypothetical protein